MLVVLAGYAADGDCCSELTFIIGIPAPCSGPGGCNVGENELCEGWGSDADRAPSSIFDSMPRRLALCLDQPNSFQSPGQPNFFQSPDLNFFAHGRSQMTTTSVSSNTPASIGPVASQKLSRGLKLEGPSNSFMLFIPKY